jgi:lipopolysaccharide transport system permease protein
MLGVRDIKLRYRQTVLGIAWVIFQPLLAAGIFSIVFGTIAHLSSNGTSYFVFSYAGLLAWNVFSSTLLKASGSVVGNAQLVSKVYFPRTILPLSTVFSTLLDFAVTLMLMGVLMVVYRLGPHSGLILLPVWLFLVIAMGLGLGLFAGALAVTYRDVGYVLPVLVPFLMYASPVAYAVSVVPERLRALYWLNPLTGLLEAFRWSLLGRGEFHWGYIVYSAAISIALLASGLAVFESMERRCADVI